MFYEALDFHQKDTFMCQRILYGNDLSECVKEMS